VPDPVPTWLDHYPGLRTWLQGDEALLYDAEATEVRTSTDGMQVIACEDSAYREAIQTQEEDA
jgi:hypothetical protein